MNALMLQIIGTLRKAASGSVALTATFPSTTKVGDTVNFDVTATLADGATGTPTITVDQLPAGLSLGSTSMVDSTHYKATVSGTLTTVQTITSTFGATGTTPTPDALVWNANVTAGGAASAVGIVQVGVTADNQSSNTSEVITFASAPTAGHKLVVAAYSGLGTPSVDGFTTVTSLTPNGNFLYWFEKVSDGTEQNITVAFGASSASHGCGAVELDAGATLGDAYATSITLSATGNVVGPSSAPASQGTPLLFGFFNGSSDSKAWGWPVGWIGTGPADGGGSFPYNGSVMAGGPAASSAFTITVTRPSTRGNSTTLYWSDIWAYPV